MRINFKYGAAVGILAAAFGTLGPAAHAGQTPGTSVPNRAGAVSVQAPAAHLPGITGRSVVLSSTFERSAWRHDIKIAQRDDSKMIAQREDNNVGSSQQRLGLQSQQARVLMPTDRCDYWGSWQYYECRYPDHHRCWWQYGWYDHYHHYHYGWHQHCRYYDHYDHYDHYGHYGHHGM